MDKPARIRAIFTPGSSPAFEPLSAIFPRHMAPVVRQTADNEREVVMMSWVFMLLQQGRAPRPVTNVRDDKILTSTFWKSSFQERRCLVPATSFCEPNGDVKPTTSHWFAIKGDEERPLFAFPGIWKRYHGPVKKDGPNVEIESYSFLDNDAQLARLHHQPRAHLCPPDPTGTWLRGTSDEAFALAREYPPKQMRIVREGFDKHDLLTAA